MLGVTLAVGIFDDSAPCPADAPIRALLRIWLPLAILFACPALIGAATAKASLTQQRSYWSHLLIVSAATLGAMLMGLLVAFLLWIMIPNDAGCWP